jgi:transcriptional regulator with AAA-type ATPase domain
MTPSQRTLVRTVLELAYTNPFLPPRIAAERAALGPDFVHEGPVWSRTSEHERPNVINLKSRIETLAADLRTQMISPRHPPADPDRALYADLVLYVLYYRTWTLFDPCFEGDAVTPRRVPAYRQIASDYDHIFPTQNLAPAERPEHLFALFFQIRRAFYFIFRNIIGASAPVANLRASVWQSIFTHDLAAYRRGLYQRLGGIPTLITGPSGTGKELVARAIALSRYIPFDPAKLAFQYHPHALFFPLNLSALAPTLIESELFGHRKGAFTGALEDHSGYLDLCPERGTVFLDEIGELDPHIQVKLLRVLQSRTFNRIGDTALRQFSGKLIAATNRDLSHEMQQGRFRTDLYYRLCADLVAAPSLADQLRRAPDLHAELATLVHFIAAKIVGNDPEQTETLTRQTVEFIEQHLPDHTWPGNFRELEQCVRNILIRKTYTPPHTQPTTGLEQQITAGSLNEQQLLERYTQLVYRQTKSYVQTATRLGIDRRTVKSRVAAASSR